MRRALRLAAGAGLGIITAGAAATTIPVKAAPATTYVVGVDNARPAGHNFQYVDYFPRTGLTVQSNTDVVDFKWNSGNPDGFHTVTFLPPGTSPPPFALPDPDDSPSGLVGNGAAFGPSFGGLGSAPCGDLATNPCTYTGAATISSGARPTAPGGDFFVKFNVTAGTTLTYHCLIHPAMTGDITVGGVDSGTPAPTVPLLAATQYAADTAAALAKEAATNNSSVTTNPDGTHTLSMTAGTAVPYVEILEMLPNNVTVQPGDKVKWTTTAITDIHTVTFPTGAGSNSVDPFGAPVCETSTTTDTPAPNPGSPPPFGCTTAAESPIFPQPQGPTAISSPTTVATSGIIAGGPPVPFPTNYTFSFPNSGTFLYQCRIHDHMVGTVQVLAAVAPTPTPGGLPVPGTGGALAAAAPHGGGPASGLSAIAAAALLLALSVLGVVRTRRTDSSR